MSQNSPACVFFLFRLENWFYRARKKVKKSKERTCGTVSDFQVAHLHENVAESVEAGEQQNGDVTTYIDQNIMESNSTTENITSSRLDKPVHLSNIDALLDAARLDSLYEEQNHLAVISSRIEHPSQSFSSHENYKKRIVEVSNETTWEQSYREPPTLLHDKESFHSRTMANVASSSHHCQFDHQHHLNPHHEDNAVNLNRNP